MSDYHKMSVYKDKDYKESITNKDHNISLA